MRRPIFPIRKGSDHTLAQALSARPGWDQRLRFGFRGPLVFAKAARGIEDIYELTLYPARTAAASRRSSR